MGTDVFATEVTAIWKGVGKKSLAPSLIIIHSRQTKNPGYGCGKGFLLYDFLKVIPDAEIYGIDISEYAISNCKPEIRNRLQVGNATNLPWNDNTFDLQFQLPRCTICTPTI